MEKFIVLAHSRAGSHYFESIITQHPDIHCFHEIFSSLEPNHFFHYLLQKIKEQERNIITSNWPTIFENYLQSIYSDFSGFKAVGMDIKYYQFPWVPGLFVILKRNNVKIIHLIRKNILKHYIAWQIHTMRDQLGRKFHETEKVPPVKINIPLDSLLPELKKRREILESYRHYLSSNFDYLEIAYEDCFDNPELLSQKIHPYVWDQVYDFLHIEDRRYDYETKFVKSNPGLLSDLVENYNELVDFLSGTEWAYLLNDTIGENIKSASQLNEEGEKLYNAGKKQEALEFFMKTIKFEPNFAEGYNNVGALLFEIGDHSRAMEYLRKATELDKTNSMYADNYSDVLQFLGL